MLLAFDATADFGPGGPAAAQEVLEVLLGAIPPAVPTALVAYDGGLRLDREPWAANLPPRVESLLASLWRLEDGGDRAHAADFLARAVELAGGAQGEKVLIYVTGAGEPADAAALDALRVPAGRAHCGGPGRRRAAWRMPTPGSARVSGGAAVALDPDEDAAPGGLRPAGGAAGGGGARGVGPAGRRRGAQRAGDVRQRAGRRARRRAGTPSSRRADGQGGRAA